MPLNIDSSLAQYERMLKFHASRASALASNIANADTPNYLAKDLDVKSFAQMEQGHLSGLALQRSQRGVSLRGRQTSEDAPLLYRNPYQTPTDGNTVDINQEKMQFAQNALYYQAAITLLDGKLKGIVNALRGE